MERKVAKPDLQVAKIAAKQHGVLSVRQLRRCGLSEAAIRRRLAAGRLHRLHRGVYAVGHVALAPQGRLLGAVLAVGCGPHDGGAVLAHWGAAASHRSAAFLWELVSDAEGACHVIVSGDAGRMARTGVYVHRSVTLLPAEVTLRHGVPVTTPARTIADLRLAARARLPGEVPPRELRRAIRQANVLGLPLDEADARDHTRSDLEGAFLSLCRRHRLPRPEVNARIGTHLVDFLWRDRHLVVETDGYRFHRGLTAFRDDRARGVELASRGYEVVRLSEEQLDDPKQVAKMLATKLGCRVPSR